MILPIPKNIRATQMFFGTTIVIVDYTAYARKKKIIKKQ